MRIERRQEWEGRRNNFTSYSRKDEFSPSRSILIPYFTNLFRTINCRPNNKCQYSKQQSRVRNPIQNQRHKKRKFTFLKQMSSQSVVEQDIINQKVSGEEDDLERWKTILEFLNFKGNFELQEEWKLRWPSRFHHKVCHTFERCFARIFPGMMGQWW